MSSQDICIVDYSGPQGSKELQLVESANVTRQKNKARVKTMNRQRRAIGMQTGTADVSVTLTVIPDVVDPEVDWHKSWSNDEVFSLTIEKGLDGVRELIQGCEVSSINNTYSESGEAREEISIEGLVSINEPK